MSVLTVVKARAATASSARLDGPQPYGALREAVAPVLSLR